MKKNKLLFLLLVLALTLLSALTIFLRNEGAGKKTCLGSFRDFAYTPPSENGDPEILTGELLKGEWRIEATVPDDSSHPYIVFSVEASRSMNGHKEIWLKKYNSNGLFSSSDPEDFKFLIYQTDTKVWQTLSAQVVGSSAYVNKIFVTKDGSVWGSNIWSNPSDSIGQPILSRFNDELKQFEFVVSTKNIPIAWRDADSRTNDAVFWSIVLLDPNEIFWIIPRKDIVYSYNPVTNQVEIHTNISDIYTKNAVSSPDGNIYIAREPLAQSTISSDYKLKDGEILRYSPKTEGLEVLENPNGKWPAYGNLFVDHAGNLWLGAVGWWSPKVGWNKIYPNSIEYFVRIEVGGIHSWVEPEALLESSDKKLWFRVKGRGMAWLDVGTMVGCWFTTEYTNIFEDQDKILWIVADRRLYNHQLSP